MASAVDVSCQYLLEIENRKVLRCGPWM